jgi:multiple PDZ domain protein
MLVVAVVGGGCIARDGRIAPGDYLVSVNNESLRKVTNSQARAILRRTQLLSTDIRCVQQAHNLILAEYVTAS